MLDSKYTVSGKIFWWVQKYNVDSNVEPVNSKMNEIYSIWKNNEKKKKVRIWEQ